MNALATGLTALAVMWSVTIIAAPLALATPPGAPAAVIYAGASGICHQRPERSFHLHGLPLPVCARCSGLYFSGAAGALFAWGPWRRRRGASRTVLFAAALPTAVTWMLEAAGLVAFSNFARALAALPLGAYAGWLFVRMLRYDSRLDAQQNLDG